MGGSGNKSPLLSDTDTDVGGRSLKQEIQLYDDLAMLQMKKSLCQGYIILLTGGVPPPEQPLKKKKNKKGKRCKDADDPARRRGLCRTHNGQCH